MKHIIRNKDDKLIEANLTPGRAVRLHCVECVGSVYDVKDCGGHHVLSTGKPCDFFPYRMGKGRVSVKVIRKFCLDCMGNSFDMVKNCPTETCTLWPYRFGRNPDMKGKGYFAQKWGLQGQSSNENQSK